MAKKQNGFTIWYNSPAGQRTVGIIYSLGAAVVMVGALFKLQHYPLANVLLPLGLLTEAFLFTIGIFEKPKKEFNWDKVFPTLMDMESEPFNWDGVIKAGKGTSIAANDTIPETDAQSLRENLKKLNETAKQLTTLSNAANATDEYTKNISKASTAAASFAEKQDNLGSTSVSLLESYQKISNDMLNASEQTKQYVNGSESLNKSMNAINSIYEMQLKAVKLQSESAEKQLSKSNELSENLEKMLSMIKFSINDWEAYKQQTSTLLKQVSDLNDVYGNMLNAIHN